MKINTQPFFFFKEIHNQFNHTHKNSKKERANLLKKIGKSIQEKGKTIIAIPK